MNVKIVMTVLLSLLLITAVAEAQVIVVTRQPRHEKFKHPGENLPKFQPALNLSIGYGFPDVDRKYLPDYYGYDRGTISQSGVFTGALDYRFSRRMSIGILVAHGAVSAPYYSYYSSPSAADLTTRLETWSFMIQIIRYIPISLWVTPYIKTAIGFNSWKQQFRDANGNETAVTHVDVPDFAHQIALGVKFRLSRRAGLFVEGGYGKYIVLGGLSIKL